MYLSFYGLSEKPFNLTPDASFLYPSQIHREVLGHLLFGINNRKGFICITGEVGSGKTTLCRVLLNQLDQNTEVAFVLNSYLTEFELLKAINEDLGIATTGRTRKELIDELNRYLIEKNSQGKNIVVIIDESQNLSIPVLEQLRMLSNLETEKEKLLQIILVGQPELTKLLQNEKIRQLNQRITVRHHLTPLTKEELKEYIYHRLNIAGSRGDVIFTDGAISEVFRFSKGIPRAINVICDQTLLVGYVMNSRRITRAMVRKAVREVLGGGTNEIGAGRLSGKTMASRAAVGFAVVAAVVFGYFSTVNYTKYLRSRPDNENPVPAKESDEIKSDLNKIVFSQDNGKNETDISRTESTPNSDTGSVNSDKQYFLTSKEAGSESPESQNHNEETSSLLMTALSSGAGSILGRNIESVGATVDESITVGQINGIVESGDGKKDDITGTEELNATIDLLRLWQIEEQYLKIIRNTSDGISVDPEKTAKVCGIGYVIIKADIDTLKSVNIPAIVELKSGSVGEQYAAVKRISDSSVTIVASSAEHQINLEEFSSMMTGEMTIYCNDTFVNPVVLKTDMEMNIDIRKLQEYLQKLGYFDGNCSGWFTAETEEAVLKFQTDNNLKPTGEATGFVKLMIYEKINSDTDIPRLTQ